MTVHVYWHNLNFSCDFQDPIFLRSLVVILAIAMSICIANIRIVSYSPIIGQFFVAAKVGACFRQKKKIPQKIFFLLSAKALAKLHVGTWSTVFHSPAIDASSHRYKI